MNVKFFIYKTKNRNLWIDFTGGFIFTESSIKYCIVEETVPLERLPQTSQMSGMTQSLEVRFVRLSIKVEYDSSLITSVSKVK